MERGEGKGYAHSPRDTTIIMKAVDVLESYTNRIRTARLHLALPALVWPYYREVVNARN